MLPDDLIDLIDGTLEPLGARPEVGEEYERPALDVLRYWTRLVRVGPLPVLGRCRSVVAVIRQPIDLDLSGALELRGRLARAVDARFPPWPRGGGASVALTAIVLTPEPITPRDDDRLTTALAATKRSRVVALGWFLLNLGQEAMSFALAEGPDQLFPEPQTLAEVFSMRFRRFLPPLDFSA